MSFFLQPFHRVNQIGTFRLFLSIFLLMLSVSCAHHTDDVLSKDSELLWDLATEAFENGDWYSARLFYDKYQKFYPQSKNAAMARLRIADTNFNEFLYFDAEVHYENFIELHPKNDEIPYAWYQLALTQKEQVPGIVARDLSKAYDALHSFHTYMTLPNRNVNLDILAESHLHELEGVLLRKELRIANWYYKTKHLTSAFFRYKTALTKFMHLRDQTGDTLFEAAHKMSLCAINLKNRSYLSEAKRYLIQFDDHPEYESTSKMIEKTNTESWTL